MNSLSDILGRIFFSAFTEKIIDTTEYKLRKSLMNSSEISFFHLLRKELPPEFHIFPKMRIADILETIDGKGYYTRRNKILPKHIDFVVCDNNFRPLLGIEIDGSSHRSADQQEKDRLKDSIFEKSKFPLRRVMVGSSFSDIVIEIRSLLVQ